MRNQMIATGIFASLLLFGACDPSGGGSSGGSSGSGSGGGSGGGPAAGVAPRMWERSLLPANVNSIGIAATAQGKIDLVYQGWIDSTVGIFWMTSDGTPELVAADMGIEISRPHVVRDVNDIVHVVWASDGNVRYAFRMGTAWTIESIAAERFRPDIAVASNGTPHVAFVDEQTGNGSAYHAVRDAGMWKIESVHATDYFKKSEAVIGLSKDDRPIIAAPDKENLGIWVAEADGMGAWKVDALAADQFSIGPLDLDIGDAGVAVAFKAEQYSMVAFRAAGASTWTVEPSLRHDQAESPINIIVGKEGPLVAADVDEDLPNGFGVFERPATGWTGQLIAPWTCSAVAMTRDSAAEPLVALNCSNKLYLMRVIGRYPSDWPATCEQAAQELCKPACGCGSNGEQCCWGLNGSSNCTSSFGCPINAVAAVCGDPSVTPEALQACRNEIPTLACGMDGPLDLTGACAPLYQPFQ